MSDTAEIEYWFYAKDGQPVGPIPRDELASLLAAGTLPPTTSVWCAEWPTWQAASTAPALSTPRATIPWGRIAVLTTLAIAAAALSISQLFIIESVVDAGSPDQVSPLWAAIVAFAATLGIIAVAALWHSAPSLARSNPRSPLPGTARAAAVVVGTIVTAFAAFGVAQIPQISALAVVLAEYDDYTIAYDDKVAALRIDGVIGPRFAANLEKALDSHGTQRILINSIGGLLDEAMAAAQMLEPRNVEIVVRESCNSACLVVFAAGAKRYAHLEARFGFHAAFPLLDSELARKLVVSQASEADEYVIARGAPRDIVDEANRLGAQTMRMAWAVDLVQRGFVNHVYDGDHVTLPLPVDIARWRAVEFVLEDEYWQVTENLRAIRESAPNQVTRRAGELDMPVDDDVEPAAEAAHELIALLRRDALQAASDEAVADYTQIYERAVDALIAKEDWENCAVFVGSPAWTYGVPSPARIELARALGRMIKSAEDRDWSEVKMSSDMHETYTGVKANADIALMAEQDDDPDRRACLHASKLSHGINALGATKAVEAFRYADRFGALSK